MQQPVSLAIAAALAWIHAGSTAAGTLNVPADYPTIQAGVDAAVDGDVVIVADGTYTGPGNTNVTFLGKAITVRSQNGPQHCVINGQLSARGFSFGGGEGPDSVLDGFSVVNGFASPGGGGINTYASSPTIRNCIITDCYGFDFGGAIRIIGGNPTIIRCTFADNYTDWFGGGFFIQGGHTTVVDCVFSGNNGLADGGGLYVYYNTSLTIANCTFTGNYHSGIDFASSSGHATIVNCLFAGNVDSGIIVSGNSIPEITNCTLVLNTHPYGGGALYASGFGTADVNNCILWGNVGAGQVNGGDIIVNHSIIEGGWSGSGAGNIDADPLLAPGPGGSWTSAAAFDPATNTTVFTDATATFVPSALAGMPFNPNLGQSRLLHILDNTQTTISVVGNFTTTFVGTYAAPNGDEPYQVFDARVLSGSPAIDSGNNAAVPGGITTDLAGQPRFADDPATPDTGLGTPPIVDRGAYEFQPCLADLDADGAVGTADFLGLLSAWGPCVECDAVSCPADLDGDCAVGVTDFLGLLGAWGPCQ